MTGVRAAGLAALALALVLAGCGGGGGGGSSPSATPSPQPVPDPAPDPDPDPTPDPTPDPDPDPEPDPDPDPVGEVAVSGTATFDRVPHAPNGALAFAAATREPIAGATVQALSSSGAVLDSATTSADGSFSVSVPAQTLVRVRVRAEIVDADGRWAFSVVDNVEASPRPEEECWAVENSRSKPVYAVETDLFDSGSAAAVSRDVHAASGWDGSRYSADRAAAPFSVLAVAEAVRRLLISADPNIVLPPLKLNWSEDNVASADNGFNPCSGEIATSAYVASAGRGQIYLLGDAASDADEFDVHVIAHEMGHYYEDGLSRSDSPGGAHAIFDRLDLRLAFSEGWGNAFSAMVLGDPVYKDSLGELSGFTFDIERNGVLNAGWFNESSVHSVLYDLFDASADGLDSLALGFAPLHDILTGPQRSTRAMTSIFTFISALRQSRSDLTGNIDQLVSAQDIVAATIDPWGSTEENDAGLENVLPVYGTLTVGGPGTAVCSAILSAGDFYSKLGNRQLLRLSVDADGPVVITASGDPGTDPDFVVHDAGFGRFAESADDGLEVATFDLAAGEYVVEVYEWQNLTSPPRGTTCFEVTATNGLTLGGNTPVDPTSVQDSDLKGRPGLPVGKPRPDIRVERSAGAHTRGARFELEGRLATGAGTQIVEVSADGVTGVRVDSLTFDPRSGRFLVSGWMDDPAQARVGLEAVFEGSVPGVRRWTLSATPSGLPPLRRTPARVHSGVRTFRPAGL